MSTYVRRCLTVHWRALAAALLLATLSLAFGYIQQSAYVASRWTSVGELAVLPTPEDLNLLFADELAALSPTRVVSQVGLAVTNTLPAIAALFFLGCRLGAADFETRMAPTEVARDGRRAFLLGRLGLSAALGAAIAIVLLIVGFVLATWSSARLPGDLTDAVGVGSPRAGDVLVAVLLACLVAAMHAVFGFCLAVSLRQSAAAFAIGVVLYLAQVALVRGPVADSFAWLPLSAQWDLATRHFTLAGGTVHIPDVALAPSGPVAALLVVAFIAALCAATWARFRKVAL